MVIIMPSRMRKRKGLWWPSRTSNPVYRVNSLVGGFDSHALPPFFALYQIKPLLQTPLFLIEEFVVIVIEEVVIVIVIITFHQGKTYMWILFVFREKFRADIIA